MTPDKFTTDRKLFKDLLFCNNLDDMRLLKERLLNAVLNAEAEEQVGAVLHEHTEKRITYRNGYRNRDLNSRDGTFKMHEENHGKVISVGLFIVLGVNEEGKREVLGFDVSEKESEASWKEIFQSLKDRGLEGVKLVTSDAHCGIQNAI